MNKYDKEGTVEKNFKEKKKKSRLNILLINSNKISVLFASNNCDISYLNCIEYSSVNFISILDLELEAKILV